MGGGERKKKKGRGKIEWLEIELIRLLGRNESFLHPTFNLRDSLGII